MSYPMEQYVDSHGIHHGCNEFPMGYSMGYFMGYPMAAMVYPMECAWGTS